MTSSRFRIGRPGPHDSTSPSTWECKLRAKPTRQEKRRGTAVGRRAGSIHIDNILQTCGKLLARRPTEPAPGRAGRNQVVVTHTLRYLKHPITWSFTRPTACMKA